MLATLSILTLALLGDQKPIRVGEPVGRVLAEARSGLAYVWKRRWICAIMLQGTVQVAFLTAPLNILLPLALRGTDGAYGWVVVAQSLGAVVGATIAVRREYVRPGLVAIGGATLELTLMIAVAADAHPIVIGGTGFLARLGLALFGILWTTALQKEVPDAMLGRVFSLDMLTAIGLALCVRLR